MRHEVRRSALFAFASAAIACSPILALAQTGERPILYYQDPDGKPAYSLAPKATPDGRPYRAVSTDKEMPGKTGAPKRVLYYRNPMGLPDVSPTPKKDGMGMDYIAVYDGEDDGNGTITLSPEKVQRTGVTTAAAEMRVISEPLRAPGTIQLDERRVSVISLRTDAFVETVENITTGSEVKKGQPLMTIYSPAISQAAAEYAAVSGGAAGTRQRLLNFAVPETLVAEIERTKRAPLKIVWTAPRDGLVLERNVSDGMKINAGDVLFRIADHGTVWALIDIPEAQLGRISVGQAVQVRARAYPDRVFAGAVALVYPHLIAETRTVRVRIELPNHDLALLPDMYVEASIETGSGSPVLSVPQSALLDSGEQQSVIISKGEGRFEPRVIKAGVRGGGYVEIRDGLKAGDIVVTSATFLIDAESNLKAALKGLQPKGSTP